MARARWEKKSVSKRICFPRKYRLFIFILSLSHQPTKLHTIRQPSHQPTSRQSVSMEPTKPPTSSAAHVSPGGDPVDTTADVIRGGYRVHDSLAAQLGFRVEGLAPAGAQAPVGPVASPVSLIEAASVTTQCKVAGLTNTGRLESVKIVLVYALC